MLAAENRPAHHIGAFEIVGKLGEGGMGEVYRAFDPKLRREVAIKILPVDLSGNAELQGRFEREAHAISALAHPNVVTVYEFGRDGATTYIAMELVSGERLRDLIAAGPLPLRKALRIGAQIASGLGAAHRKGILHRDLKPENVMVTPEGLVKILDFGVAKVLESRDEREAETISDLTRAGVLVGTVSYMSPEQASGRTLDTRSDQFAFGALFYEMLTGRRAFRRDSSTETLAAIIRDEPESLASLGHNPPQPLVWILDRCLAKNPEDRYGSTQDLARDLQCLSDSFSALGTPAIASDAAAGGRRGLRWPRAVAAAALLAVVTVALLIHALLAPGPTVTFTRQTFRRGSILSARLAADQKTIVYGAEWEGWPIELFATRLTSPEARSLDLPGAQVLSISAHDDLAVLVDRERVAGHLYSGTLAQLSLGGGAPRALLSDVQYADWAPDAQAIAVVRGADGKRRLEFPAGHVLYETGGWIGDPRVSPQGDRIAFIDHPVLPDDRGCVALVDLDGKRTALTEHWMNLGGLAWTPDGKEIWFSGGQEGSARSIYAVSRSGTLRLVYAAPASLTVHDIAPDGSVLASRDEWSYSMQFRGQGEAEEHALTWFDGSLATDLSADGKRLLFAEIFGGGGGRYGAYLRGTDGSLAARLGTGLATSLSRDGNWALAVVPDSPGQLELLPTGAGSARTLPRGPLQEYDWAEWFPDAQRVAIAGRGEEGGTRIWIQDIAGGDPHPISDEGVEAAFTGLIVSPDGKRVVAHSASRGLASFPVDGGEAVAIRGSDPWDLPVGFGEGPSELYVARYNRLPAVVSRISLEDGRREDVLHVEPASLTGVQGISTIVIAADGKAYAYSFSRLMSELYLIEGLR